LRALGIKSKIPIKLSLNPYDQGFLKEFSLYGFREFLNSLLVYHIVRKHRLSVVIDIGANLGYYVALEALAGAKKIIAVEPLPLTFSYLCKNLRAFENFVALNIAVVDRDREASMVIPDSFNVAHIIREMRTLRVYLYLAFTLKVFSKYFGTVKLVLPPLLLP
jgi:predicted RNA methylase